MIYKPDSSLPLTLTLTLTLMLICKPDSSAARQRRTSSSLNTGKGICNNYQGLGVKGGSRTKPALHDCRGMGCAEATYTRGGSDWHIKKCEGQ